MSRRERPTTEPLPEGPVRWNLDLVHRADQPTTESLLEDLRDLPVLELPDEYTRPFS